MTLSKKDEIKRLENKLRRLVKNHEKDNGQFYINAMKLLIKEIESGRLR